MLASAERSQVLPQFIVAEYPLSSFPLEIIASPESNPLLIEHMEIGEEAMAITQQERLHPYLAPFVQININGGVMGRQAELDGWGNIKNHIMLSHSFVKAGAQILKLSAEETMSVQAAALIHDCDTRRTKQELPLIEVECDGIKTLQVDQRLLFEIEMNDSGPQGIAGLESINPEIASIAGVTHADFRRAHLWDHSRKLMRLADSSVGSKRNNLGGYVEDVVMTPEERWKILKECKPVFDQMGYSVYDIPTFDKWLQVTHDAEWDLRQLGEQNNPALFWCYFYDNPQKTRLGDLIQDVMKGRVIPPGKMM